MELLSAGNGDDWMDLSLDATLSEDQTLARTAARTVLRGDLAAIAGSETLMILAGSGSSVGITSGDSVHAAPSMSALWDAVSAHPEFTRAATELSLGLVSSRNLEHVLSEAQARSTFEPADGPMHAFVAKAQKTVWQLCNFVDSESKVESHEIFLRKVARRSTRLQRAQIFTTNYDLVFETAAQRTRFNVIDGFGYAGGEFDGALFDLDFVRRRPNEPLALEPNVFHLLKVHGSVDWNSEKGAIRKAVGTPTHPVLIYPSATKYQLAFQQPHLELMSRFQIALRQPNLGLIVVGFGFNDDHLTAPIEAALRSNVSLRAIFVSPGVRDSRRAETFKNIESLIKNGDRRLTLLQGTFADLARELPEVPLQEERDAHADRFDSARGGGGR